MTSTSYLTNEHLNPINDNFSNESFILPEVINSLPIKRLYDFKSKKLKELVKLNHELNCEFDQVILKVKLIGIDYNHDFITSTNESKNRHPRHSHYNRDHQPNPKQIVPGFKIIGKVHQSRSSSFSSTANKKYLVFPYSNCLLQNQKHLCQQCQFLLNKQSHISSSFPLNDFTPLHTRYQCLNNIMYGINIDGGFQDYLKILHPKDSLVEIPKNVSMHDCLFLYDIMLPFYSFLQSSSSNMDIMHTGKVLIILNDSDKELNDVLIILNHFKQIDQSQISIVDYSKIKSSMISSKYHKRFDQILIFNKQLQLQNDNDTMKLIQLFSASNGLESTKSRYNVIIFNNHLQTIPQSNQLQQHQQDKAIHHFKLAYKDKLHLEQVLLILSDLNSSFNSTTTDEANLSASSTIKPRVSIGSMDSTISSSTSTSSASISSSSLPSTPVNESSPNSFSSGSFNEDNHHHHHNHGQTHQNHQGKNLRFRGTASIINAYPKSKKKITHHWLNCDYDFDLVKYDEDEEDYNDNDDEYSTRQLMLKKSHNIKHINKIIRTASTASRVCYNNKSNRPTKLNAFIFC
ncbi:hypothetical protein DFJ63DRAFT_336844 [Scheffersomyces coipomensis]|uniref:uncharacterized protein n=1 Tax=Scheffersomyces coipomensis TaxID=1788519 RepID=UPI00315CD60E